MRRKSPPRRRAGGASKGSGTVPESDLTMRTPATNWSPFFFECSKYRFEPHGGFRQFHKGLGHHAERELFSLRTRHRLTKIVDISRIMSHAVGYRADTADAGRSAIPLDALRVLADVIREIPPEWYEDDYDAVTKLLEQLYRRRIRVPELLLEAKNTTRHPFPNWR